MKRRLFTVPSTLSLLLFAAIGVLWIRSHAGGGTWRRQSYDSARATYVEEHVTSTDGGLWFFRRHRVHKASIEYHTRDYALRGLARGWTYHPRMTLLPPAPSEWWERIGFHFARVDEVYAARRTTHHAVGIPYWFPAGLVLTPWIFRLVVWQYRWHRGRGRSVRNRCRSCGYDLRATPGRCPECGSPVAREGNA